MGICCSTPSAAGRKNPPVIFFPDAKMPCKAFMEGKSCTRGLKCNFAHEATSLSRLLGRGLHSSTFRLNVSTFCETLCVCGRGQ